MKVPRFHTKPQNASPRTASRALRFDQAQVRFNCAWLTDVYPLKRRMQRIEQIVVRNYSRGLCFRTALIERLRSRAGPRDGILMMQPSQDRFREYDRTRRQSMSGFGLLDYP